MPRDFVLIVVFEVTTFLLRFLYTSIPRKRLDPFAESLAHGIYERFKALESFDAEISVSERDDLTGDFLVDVLIAAEECTLSVKELLALWPQDLTIRILNGKIYAVANATGRALYGRLIWPNDNVQPRSYPASVFAVDYGPYKINLSIKETEIVNTETGKAELHRQFLAYRRGEYRIPAQAFSCTRFGSTKLKSHNSCLKTSHTDPNMGCYNFTMPSTSSFIHKPRSERETCCCASTVFTPASVDKVKKVTE